MVIAKSDKAKNVALPSEKLIVVRGLSGSGKLCKSSFAFENIYVEGQSTLAFDYCQ